MAIPLRPLQLFAQQFADFVTLSGDEPFKLLQTTFGLRLKISDIKDGTGVITIHDGPSLQPQKNDDLENTERLLPHYYRLLPDYQMFFLWYDPEWPRRDPDKYHVDDDVIKERYPVLMSFHDEWVTRYHTAFYLSFQKDRFLFPDLDTNVAWEVAGFFIAWWLLLQNDVMGVRYELNKHFVIKKDNIEEKLREFLIDVNGYQIRQY